MEGETRPARTRGWQPPLIALLAVMLTAITASAATVDTAAWYLLVNRNSGKAVDVYNLATNDGARIALEILAKMRWMIKRFADGNRDR